MISALLILILAGHSFGTEAGQELVQISGVTQPHAPFAYASNTAPPHTPVSLDERPAEDRALKLDAEAHVAHPLSSDNPESSRRHEVAITIDAVTARGSDDAAVMNQNRAGKEKHKATAKPHSGTKQRKELELVKGKKHPVISS
ncbi:hypothetical protein PCANC_11154 [Puccinia coronata f. sp. avenae]|uniref:Uncharacterized protein n=1 Tax=Puccinia coronata f. sp. avenae TaxID=200324 RepID=A0A2N5URN8_9BASI|nr:hypothetical protein PCANC_11706 [Puccinia coronata f. sp. avenae]PLW40307.1 hypothetical protein PCANC_11154 [Puccinia coronata f. sp. avenae]